jgi:SET domain-containing protein
MNQTTFDEAVTLSRSAVAVIRVDGHYRVLATRDLPAGTPIFAMEGVRVDAPTRYSVQIGAAEHLAPPVGEDLETTMDRRPWRFLNHSCAPNAAVKNLALVALRDIPAWEQLTFDYNCTEMLLATPFKCQCGAAECVGTVRGFLALDEQQRLQREGSWAPHLREFFEEA